MEDDREKEREHLSLKEGQPICMSDRSTYSAFQELMLECKGHKFDVSSREGNSLKTSTLPKRLS